MFYIYLWVYTLFLVIIWGVLGIITIHSFKFRNFNPKITFFIKLLFLVFITLSVIGYVILIYNNDVFSKKIDVKIEENRIMKDVSY